MNGWVGGGIDGWTDRWIDGWMNGWTGVYVFVPMLLALSLKVKRTWMVLWEDWKSKDSSSNLSEPLSKTMGCTDLLAISLPQ